MCFVGSSIQCSSNVARTSYLFFSMQEHLNETVLRRDIGTVKPAAFGFLERSGNVILKSREM